jgi:multidrug efflux pump subunit AcrB/outer membrane protein TolC
MNFVTTSLKYKQVTLTVLAMVFAVGVYSLLTMPRREDPKITVPIGLVVAHYPGATAAQVEEQVTKKIEQYLFQFAEVKKDKTYSTTRDGIVVINVSLNDNVKKPDIFWNKLRHQLYLAKNLDLPEGVRGPVVNSDFGDTEAMLIAIEGENASYQQLKDYSKLLEDKLRTIPAASKMKRIGEQKEQISVYFNTQMLSQYGISLQQIIKVLQSQNSISLTGEIQTGDNKAALYTSGAYNSQEEIENQIVGTSKQGAVIRLKDIAILKREYAEATSNITVNGHRAIIVSVQMQEGNNIVRFGKEINKMLEETARLLPSGVKLTTIVNQPQIVENNVSHFLREFLLAIISVILVVVLLLPFRIATVAATAIPITIAITFALLHAFGVELHQVSLASLIVVLGMVVDDAIVVADNYVVLLDKGVERWTAAWRSASDLTIPIFTATISIIASFMPMIIITGSIGEFIHDLPVTVTIALASSFIVAMVLTPILCYVFIKKGLHSNTAMDSKHHKKSVLDYMQTGYNKAIDWGIKHPVYTIAGGIAAILLSIVIFKLAVNQKFFPYAERNQFVVEVWMPSGYKLDKTKAAVSKIENLIKEDKRVTSYASFSGTSAPRVYYNFSPEYPVSNYGQVLINTISDKITEELAKELEQKLAGLVPDGFVQVKLMQQGQPLSSPVEIRIFGDDINTLKQLSNNVKTILRNTEGSFMVNDDFKEDFYGISIKLKNDAARLGFTTSSIAQILYTNFSGVQVSTMYEGDNAIDIVLRLDESKRSSYQDIENVYLESPATGANIPLRQIAELKPEWQAGRIMHRNGVRCLTVYSETTNGVLPAELLVKIRPGINKIKLPTGYYIEYGGEYANKSEVYTQMIMAMFISLVLIFIILLVQFRNLKETFIIMFTIPLSLSGAMLGLALTGYDFGFTAFMGFISLSGIVVRNAIILIDYTNELIKKGHDITSAALEAGMRRFRPIFLTAMAAAIGVLPLIISGSSLWGPLATVIAFGVICDMLLTRLFVPVLFVYMIKPKDKQVPRQAKESNISSHASKAGAILLLIGVSAAISPISQAQQIQGKLTLQKVQEMAIENNHYLKMKQMQVIEKQQKVNQDKVKYFPVVSVGGNYQYNSNIPQLTIAQGSFGYLPVQLGGSGIPATDKTMDMSKNITYTAGATFYQPISQIPQIREGVNVSKTELAITRAEQDKATMQVKQTAEKLYYGLLILQKQQEEAELKKAAARLKLYDAESAVSAGKATTSIQIGLNANMAEEEQNLLKISIQISDYIENLKQLIGIPDSVMLALDTVAVSDHQLFSLSIDSISNEARSGNIDLKIAGLNFSKAQYSINASLNSYIPELGVFSGYTYQKGNTLYPANNTYVGVSLRWNIQEIFTATYAKRQRIYLRMQAEENIANTKEQVETEIAKAYRHLSQSQQLIAVAQKVVDFRHEDLKIQFDKQTVGLNTSFDYLTAKAALAKAEVDLYAAHFNYRMAYTDIQILTGKY